MGENWFLVRQLRNPVRGDSGQVSVMCRRYSSLADTFESMASQLSADSGGVQQGKWAEALKEKAGELPADFSKFAESFREVVDALNDWRGRLGPWKQKAILAVREAERADADRRAARGALLQAEGEKVRAGLAAAAGADTGAQLLQVQNQISQYQQKLDEANGRIENATAKVKAVKDDYNEAAHTTAARIDAARDKAPKLSSWENIVYNDWWKALVGVAKVAAVVLALAACFFSGGALAIALAAAAAITVSDSFMQWRVGDKSGLEFGIDALFGALTVIPGLTAISNGVKAARGSAAAKEAFKMSSTNTSKILAENLQPVLTTSKASEKFPAAIEQSVNRLVRGQGSFLRHPDGLKKILLGDLLPSKKNFAKLNTAVVKGNLAGDIKTAAQRTVGYNYGPLQTAINRVSGGIQNGAFGHASSIVKPFKPIIKDGVSTYQSYSDPSARNKISYSNTMQTLVRPYGWYKSLSS